MMDSSRLDFSHYVDADRAKRIFDLYSTEIAEFGLEVSARELVHSSSESERLEIGLNRVVSDARHYLSGIPVNGPPPEESPYYANSLRALEDGR